MQRRLTVGAHFERAVVRNLCLASAVTAATFASPISARAEPVVDRALSDVQVLEGKGCVRLRIGFNFRVRYSGHIPTGKGGSLAVQVRAVDRIAALSMSQLKREALRPLSTSVGNVRSIEYDVAGGLNPRVLFEFDRPLAIDAAQGADFTSIVVSLADPRRKAACPPVFPGAGSWQTSVSPAAPTGGSDPFAIAPVRRRTGKASAKQVRSVGAAIDESRAAIKKGRHAEAIDKLRNALETPENKYTREAQELLGTAYLKSGDPASARAQFEDYLARYPADEDSRRVRQRLRGVLTALGEPPPKLKSVDGRSSGAASQRHEGWSVSGSVSQFYLRNDSFRSIRDPSLPPQANPDPDEHRVHQNTLLSGLDVSASWSNSVARHKFRFSGTEEHDFSGEDGEIVGIAALYLDSTFYDYNVDVRLGRQTQSANGVLGRFDGAEIVWRASDLVRFGLVGGSPVWSRRDEPFKEGKYFYGGNVGFTPIQGLDISLYALEQRVDDLIDRRAVGSDLRYLSPNLSVFATLDYDIHFSEVNLALLNASWTLPDKTVVYGAVDHRKSPFLTSWAALQGQPFLTLYDMLKQHSEDEIYRFAVDRTADYNSASLGVSHPFNDHWQATLDVTWTNVSGTRTSGGILGQQGTGDEFYYSSQLIGTNLTAEGDMLIAALRMADRKFTDLYVLDAQVRYPLTDKLRVSPRLRLGYLTGNEGLDLTEYTVQPSILIDYALTRDWHFETEIGTNWTHRLNGAATEDNTELFFTAGYRYDFYADPQSNCVLPVLSCQQRTR
jgi:tetratricopeptide (TPR) repeat protein